jgi:hypothetical protein
MHRERLWALLSFLSACGSRSSAEDAATLRKAHVNTALESCGALAQQAAPQTVEDAVLRINALPKPVTPACFLASLPRPLDIVLTSGVISAQPASGPKSPRIFVMLPGLVVSLVPSGRGAALIEFGQFTSERKTVKAEVATPVIEPLPSDAAFTHVKDSETSTTCGVCHGGEVASATVPGGFESNAFRPDPELNVALSVIANEHDACEGDLESERCAMFHALFDFGDVQRGVFPTGALLFSQQRQ